VTYIEHMIQVTPLKTYTCVTHTFTCAYTELEQRSYAIS